MRTQAKSETLSHTKLPQPQPGSVERHSSYVNAMRRQLGWNLIPRGPIAR
jgi:hypothetical protein